MENKNKIKKDIDLHLYLDNNFFVNIFWKFSVKQFKISTTY